MTQHCYSRALRAATFLAILVFCAIGTARAYELKFAAGGLSPDTSANLEVSFHFFHDDRLAFREPSVVIFHPDRKRNGQYDISYKLDSSREFDSFFFFGVLYPTDGSRTPIGFLPLQLVTEPHRGGRNEYHASYLQLRILPTDPLLPVERCWSNTAETPQGQAARDSFPLHGTAALRNDRPLTTLRAIKELITNRLINSCPTWNRIRGIMRDGMTTAWGGMAHKRLARVLRELGTIYDFANDDAYQEIPKIYNDILMRLFKVRGGMAQIDGKDIRTYLFDQQIKILREHFYKLLWRSHEVLATYAFTEEFEKCLLMANSISQLVDQNDTIKARLATNRELRKRLYLIMKNGNDCAARWSSSVTIADVTKFLGERKVGSEYMERFLIMFDFLNRQSGEMFPYNLDNSTDPPLAKEILKFYLPFRDWAKRKAES